MTIQTMNGGFYWPQPQGGIGGAFIFNGTKATAAANDTVAFTFVAPKTGTITGATIWLTANSGGVDLRLETVTGSGATSGQPTGTLAATTTNVAIASGSTGARTVTFTSSYSATEGENLAIVVKQSGAGGVTTAVQTWIPTGTIVAGLTKLWTSTTGTYTASIAAGVQFALNYNGTYYHIPGNMAVDSTGRYFGTVGNGSERGLQFQVPFKTQVWGWFHNYDMSGGATSDYNVTLYDNVNSGSEYGVILQKTGVLGGQTRNGVNGYGYLTMGLFGSSATLSANTNYNLAIKQTTANVVQYQETKLIDTATTAILGMFNGGTNLLGITRATVGATTFTTSNTQIPYNIGIICSGFDDGANSGGMLVHPGLSGGARG